MTIESTIFARLQAVSGLTALIGSSPCRAYFGGKAPQNPATPYVVWFRVSEQRDSAMGGDIGVVRGRYQFSVFAETADSASAVAEQLRLALQRWRNSSGGTAVQDTYLLTRQDLYEDDTKLHHAALDFEIVHQE